MTPEQVPLAAQIGAVSIDVVRRIRNKMGGDYFLHEDEAAALLDCIFDEIETAALATLQQHERAMAEMEAAYQNCAELHHNSVAGDCTKAAPVGAKTRWAMTQIENSSYAPGAGHVVTLRDHVCGDFKDDFDWSSLTLAYRARVGAPLRPNTRPHAGSPEGGAADVT